MEITLEKKEETLGILSINFNKADYEPEVDKRIKEYGKKANMKGFRPGKVPFGLLKKMVGREITGEVVNNLIGKEMDDFFKRENIDLLFMPMLKSEMINLDQYQVEEKPFEITYELFLRPDLNLSLDGISVTSYQIEPTQEEMDEIVEKAREDYGQPADVDTIEEDNDFVTVQLSAEAHSYDEESIFPLKRVAESVRELLKGKKIDDVVSFVIEEAFPDESDRAIVLNRKKDEIEALTGAFEAKIKKVSREQLAEFGPEFYEKFFGAEQAANVTDEASFYALLKTDLIKAYSESGIYKTDSDLRKILLEKYDFAVNEELLRKIFEESADNQDATEEQREKEFPKFIESVKWRVISDAFFKESGEKVTDDEVKQAAFAELRRTFQNIGYMLPDEQIMPFVDNYLKMEDGKITPTW